MADPERITELAKITDVVLDDGKLLAILGVGTELPLDTFAVSSSDIPEDYMIGDGVFVEICHGASDEGEIRPRVIAIIPLTQRPATW